MTNLFNKLRKLARVNTTPGTETAVSLTGGSLILNDETVKNLLRQVDKTEDGQYSCAETFALLDEYVELVVSNEDAAALMPLVERHLEVCPECSPRYKALLAILQTET